MWENAEFWDKQAPGYANKPVPNPTAYERKLEATYARLTPESRVLDIGCGTGSLCLTLAPRVREVHGIDISTEMTKIGRDKAKAQGADNVQLHARAVSDLGDFETGSFDMVCAYNILHLVEERTAILREVQRLMSAHGSFVSSTPCLGESWVPFGLILAPLRWIGKAPAVAVFDKATLEAEMRAEGFGEFERPEVGASADTAFWLAKKVATTRSARA